MVQSWAEIFASAQRPTLGYRTLQTTRAGDIAIHLVEETIRPGNSPDSKTARVLSTNIYRRGEDGWRLTVHHASLPLTAAVRKEPQERLH